MSYVYEDYSNDGNEDKVALRLAYHVDKQLNDDVSVFHNLEWLPAFDDPSDYTRLELSTALKRRFNFVQIPIVTNKKTEKEIVLFRTRELLARNRFEVNV